MNFDFNAPMTLAAMRATLLDDQRELTRNLLDTMGMPRLQRRQMEPAMLAAARLVIAKMDDDDVKQCFTSEKETVRGS